MFTISVHGSHALLLTADGATALPLPALTPETVTKQTTVFQQALHDANDRSAGLAGRTAAQAQIRYILGWLWDTAAQPVLSALGHHHPPEADGEWPRVWWAPGGLLGLLPIHAAGHHGESSGQSDRTVMDRVISSYTPTIGSLYHSRHQAGARQSAAGPSLIVSMPTTPGLNELKHVRLEAAFLLDHLPRPILLEEPDVFDENTDVPATVPTKASVIAALGDCTIAHFACHGHSDPADPSTSRLLLHDHLDNPFTVAALAPVSLGHARLAYLSACSTAFTAAPRLLDEGIHLASAFQLAGFPHVIGSLWPIQDDVAISLARCFYTAITREDGTVETEKSAGALHFAVRAVRDTYRSTPSLWAAYIHAGA